MAFLSAADYFQTLAQCLLNTQITTIEGTPLTLDEGMAQANALILKTKIQGKIIVIGNGGSAAIASHVQNDLCKTVDARAMVLTETALLTALTNDLGYKVAYESAILLWATSNDLLIAISSSGKSENILRAVQAAISRQCAVVTFSGFDPDNPLRRMGQLNFYIRSNEYGFVELGHSAQLHFLTDTASTHVRGGNSE